MGVQISEIIPRQEIELKDLKGKVIAVDAFNTLYQFLTTIRQVDGTPLMNSKGEITSHLSGMFYRNIALLTEEIKLVYVFDGIPSELKQKELDRRKENKLAAMEKFEKAKIEENVDDMRKYSQQTVKVDQKIIDETKELLEAMGIPTIQAEGEGEAEAALLARTGLVWASASQDYDSLLYFTPRLVRNLTLSRKRKNSSGLYVDVKIEFLEFDKVLNTLAVNQDQLICLAILVGTDYNPGGVKGIGQKRALEIVKKYEFPVKIFEFVETSEKYQMDFNWQEIFKVFKNFTNKHQEKIIFKEPDINKIREILLKAEFSQERIDSGIEKIKSLKEAKKQKGLNEFF